MPTDAHPMPHPTPRRLRVLAVGLLGLVLLLVLYVASVGPAWGLMFRSGRYLAAFDAFYWPLFKVCRSCDPLSRALDLYCHIWCDCVPLGSFPDAPDFDEGSGVRGI